MTLEDFPLMISCALFVSVASLAFALWMRWR
jgi:hypothetical protein